MTDAAAARAVEDVYRAEFGKVVASIAGRFGDLDLAEDMAQEAFVEAVRRWPTEGMPPNPGGWITTTARFITSSRGARARNFSRAAEMRPVIGVTSQ